MSFEEWWKDKWLEIDFPDSDEELDEIVKAAFRAGLLHAAEQDEEMSKSDGLSHGSRVVLTDSAAMHRQAASEVK